MKKLFGAIAVGAAALTISSCGDDIEGTEVAFVVAGNFGDASYFDACKRGMELVEEKYGDEIRVNYVEAGADESEWLPTLEDVAYLGNDVIITVGEDFVNTVNTVANSYKEQQFIHIDGSLDYEQYSHDNAMSISTAQDEPSFVAGAMAAMVSTSGKLGFVGGMDIPGINDFLVPFIQGAQYVNSEIGVYSAYTNNWSDATVAKALSDGFVANGADVLWSAAGGAGTGIFDTAAENSGVKTFGTDTDQYEALKDEFPNKANTIVSSLVKDIDNILMNVFDEYMVGEIVNGAHQDYALAEKGMYMTKTGLYESFLTETQREQIEQIEQDIINGVIVVKDVYTMTDSEVNSYINSVRPA